MTRRAHVVLVAGDVPYLGGPATWSGLRRAAPEFEFDEIDLLEATTSEDIIAAARTTIETALKGAVAIAAHGTAARIAVEAVAVVDPSLPVLLLSPRIVTRESLLLRGIRILVDGPLGNVLALVARRKRRKLLADDSFLRKQLKRLVRNDLISDELIDEATARIADPRMDRMADRTVEVVRAMLTPIDTSTNEAVHRRLVLLGNGPIDRKLRARGSGTVLEGAWAAPMLETPQAVADALRALLSDSTTASV
jgi:hypothetical protein